MNNESERPDVNARRPSMMSTVTILVRPMVAAVLVVRFMMIGMALVVMAVMSRIVVRFEVPPVLPVEMPMWVEAPRMIVSLTVPRPSVVYEL